MAGCALEGAVVSTDRQRGYVRALAEMGVAAHERFASSGRRAPLNRVNALHSALKAFLARFRGVSTRRLPNYLAWFCWAREARRGGDAASLLRAQMGSGTYRTSWRGLWRQPCPFHPEISMSYAGYHSLDNKRSPEATLHSQILGKRKGRVASGERFEHTSRASPSNRPPS